MHSPGEGIRPCDPQYQIPMPGRYTKQAFETHPKTCAHIKKSLDALWDRMPKEQRLPWERWDEGEFDPDASIHKVDKFVAILVSARPDLIRSFQLTLRHSGSSWVMRTSLFGTYGRFHPTTVRHCSSLEGQRP